ncbi:MAG: glutathione S-transferase C-terminal domain-containing protein, partial [Acetobacteraceae bacterium]|nr:glutathione S-transferase C-terminal domain-containing protein [Acetobacteraceae bacterium]
LKLFQDRIHTIPQAADDLKQIARKHLAWLDGQMQGKQYLCGERFSFADVFLFPFLDFFPTVKQPLDPALNNIAAWIDRMKPRPSAAA